MNDCTSWYGTPPVKCYATTAGAVRPSDSTRAADPPRPRSVTSIHQSPVIPFEITTATDATLDIAPPIPSPTTKPTNRHLGRRNNGRHRPNTTKATPIYDVSKGPSNGKNGLDPPTLVLGATTRGGVIAANTNTTTINNGSPEVIPGHAVKVAESGGVCMRSAKNALFGRHLPPADRILWHRTTEKDSQMQELLYCIEKTWRELSLLGLHKFLATKTRGALIFDVDGPLPSSPQEPVVDWITLEQAQETLDGRMQKYIASYDPGRQVLVFAFRLSPNEQSLTIWGMRVGIPPNLLQDYGDELENINNEPQRKKRSTVSEGPALSPISKRVINKIHSVAPRAHPPDPFGHQSIVQSVTFSSAGKRLASGSEDRDVRTPERAISHLPSPPYQKVVIVEKELLDRIVNYESQDDSDGYSSSISSPRSPSPSISSTHDITGLVSLTDGGPIGSGGSGVVYPGIHKNKGKVALKWSRIPLRGRAIQRFLREVDLSCSISHQYILSCLGICKIRADLFIVSPYIENGDILSCLRNGRELNRSRLIYEVAQALDHLHHEGIVHGDVKGSNILLSDHGSALLCDFGQAKAFRTMVTSTDVKGNGSIRWMAPELLQDGSRTTSTDVYSFGITIAEVLSGQSPFHHINHYVAVIVHVVTENGRPPTKPLRSPNGESYSTLWAAAEKCWAKNAEDRPDMAQVLQWLSPLN